mmetsp:Transcript_107614/g.343456  ORF Transcript_107614/g.343456 Transcript_107614/m.343456 type:complete len:472 (-) Transcript_107614:577-1992(-)
MKFFEMWAHPGYTSHHFMTAVSAAAATAADAAEIATVVAALPRQQGLVALAALVIGMTERQRQTRLQRPLSLTMHQDMMPKAKRPRVDTDSATTTAAKLAAAPPPRAAEPRRVAATVGKTLRRLQIAISAVPRDDRRHSLESLPKHVRLALLAFMQQEGTSAAVPGRTPAAKARQTAAAPAQNVATAAKQPAAKLCRRSFGSGGGVAQKCGGCVAHLRLVPYLVATTCCQASRSAAERLREVLERARALATEAGDWTSYVADESLSNDVQRLRVALAAACAEQSMDVHQLGLSFCATVDCHALVGCTVTGSYSTSLEEALRQRQQLLSARASGWPALREAWVDVMSSQVQVRTSGAWGRALPRARSSEGARQLADAVRRAHRERAASVQQQRAVETLRRAAGAVERALRLQSEALLRRALQRSRTGEVLRKTFAGSHRRKELCGRSALAAPSASGMSQLLCAAGRLLPTAA